MSKRLCNVHCSFSPPIRLYHIFFSKKFVPLNQNENSLDLKRSSFLLAFCLHQMSNSLSILFPEARPVGVLIKCAADKLLSLGASQLKNKWTRLTWRWQGRGWSPSILIERLSNSIWSSLYSQKSDSYRGLLLNCLSWLRGNLLCLWQKDWSLSNQ